MSRDVDVVDIAFAPKNPIVLYLNCDILSSGATKTRMSLKKIGEFSHRNSVVSAIDSLRDQTHSDEVVVRTTWRADDKINNQNHSPISNRRLN